jgi:anaerobic magnesium-protoporphyrin IX monomethyl ester cyclase
MSTVTLIRPPSIVARYGLTLNATPPLSLAYLAGSLAAAGHRVQVIDAVGEALDAVWPSYRPGLLGNGLTASEIVARVGGRPDWIGVSALFSHEWPVLRELFAALAARFPGVPLVCGGEHPTAAPEFSLTDAPELTACVLGEGEETAVELTDAIAHGRDLASVPGLALRGARGERGVIRTAPRGRIRAVDAIPLPRWDLVPIERYLERGLSFGVDRGRTMPILATRGCPYRCTFCSSPSMWTTRYVMRDPGLVVEEIERWVAEHKIQNIDFYDLTAVVKRDWILAFCRRMIERRVPVTWQLPSGTRSEAIDAEVARLLYASGCRNISYAPESGSARTLSRIKKKVRLDRMEASMRAAVESGLNVKANILVGFPGESHADVAETLRFMGRMARAGVHDASVWTFSPYPGSELYEELRAAGRIGAMDDDYFASLLSYSDLKSAVSYDDHISSEALQRYRLLGMLFFYGASFFFHPDRPARSALNLLRGRYESRTEMSLANLARKLRRGAAGRERAVMTEV